MNRIKRARAAKTPLYCSPNHSFYEYARPPVAKPPYVCYSKLTV